MNIEWKEISPDYIVSNDGRVGSRRRGGLRILAPGASRTGYLTVSLYFGPKPTTRPIHRLVAEAFLGPPPTALHEVNHKNGIKTDNRATNLEWVTRSQNLRHRIDVLRVNNVLRGERAWNARLTVAGVREIRQSILRGESQADIASRLRVSKGAVAQVAIKRNWAWLDAEVAA